MRNIDIILTAYNK